MSDQVYVYCDVAARHPKKKPRVSVNTFRSIQDDRWTSDNRSPWLQRELRRASGGGNSVGTTLAGTERYDRAAHKGREDVRSVYDLQCFKCRLFPVSLTEPRLFEVLNQLRHAGRCEVSLRELAAIVGGTTQV